MASALKRLFRIQYVSDLHLEFLTELTPQSIVKPAAPYLALAGELMPNLKGKRQGKVPMPNVSAIEKIPDDFEIEIAEEIHA